MSDRTMVVVAREKREDSIIDPDHDLANFIYWMMRWCSTLRHHVSAGHWSEWHLNRRRARESGHEHRSHLHSRARDSRQTDKLDGAVSRTVVAVGIERASTADATLVASTLAKVSGEV